MLPRLFMRNKNSEEKMLKCFRDRPTYMFWKEYCDEIELDMFSVLNYFNGMQSSKLNAKYLNSLFIDLTFPIYLARFMDEHLRFDLNEINCIYLQNLA